MSIHILSAAREVLGTDVFTLGGGTIYLGTIGLHPMPVSPATAEAIRLRAGELEQAEAVATARLAQFPNLEPDRFWFAVRAAGYEAELRAWVAGLNDPEGPDYSPGDWAWASAKLDFGKYFERDHPLVEAAREAIGMSEIELDALWRYAAL